MSLYDVNQRTDAILKKYGQYDKPMNKRRTTGGDDPFQDEYDTVEAQIEDLMNQAEEASKEQNRAVVAARNAEIRKAKQTLLGEGIEAVQKKIKKGKGVNKTIIDERQERVKALIEKIYAIPDGMGTGARRPQKQGGMLGFKGSVTLSTIGPNQLESNPLYYKQTDETQKFEQDWANSKLRQDAQLDRIERGVATLNDMAKGMQEELDKQNPVIDEIDTQLNRVTNQLKSNNAKLKGLVTQMRSKRNFCIDIILVCILLGIGAYIASAVMKSRKQA